MNRRIGVARVLSVALTTAVSLTTTIPALAHTLEVPTARVTLRDGHAEVALDIDPVALVARQRPEVGDARRLCGASDAELERLLTATREELERETRLEAEGAAVPLAVRHFPPTAALRSAACASADAAHERSTSASGRGEGRSLIRLEAGAPIAAARQVSLRLSPRLGAVLVSFVQPSMHWTQPGETAAFAVLAPPTAAPPLPAKTERSWAAVAAGVLALFAVAAQWVSRRRTDASLGVREAEREEKCA